MAIKTNIKVLPVSWLRDTYLAGKLNTDISIQRNEVWGLPMKSNFIVSLLLDIPIESLLFERVGDDAYNVLDGKQRSLSLCSFVNDEFALSSKIETKEIDGLSLVGLTFLDMPEKLRSKILNYQLSFAVMEPLSEDLRERVFYMRNQSVHLSKMDLSRVILGKKERDILTKLTKHVFIQEKLPFTNKACQNHDDLKALIQLLMLKVKPDTGFSAPEIMAFCQDLKSKTYTIPDKEIKATLTYLNKAFPEKRKYLTKIHLPQIMLLADIAKNNGLSADSFGERVDEFFADLTPEHDYAIACQSGRSKKPDVQARFIAASVMLEDLDYKEINDFVS